MQRFGDEPQPVRLQVSDGPAGLAAPILSRSPATRVSAKSHSRRSRRGAGEVRQSDRGCFDDRQGPRNLRAKQTRDRRDSAKPAASAPRRSATNDSVISNTPMRVDGCRCCGLVAAAVVVATARQLRPQTPRSICRRSSESKSNRERLQLHSPRDQAIVLVTGYFPERARRRSDSRSADRLRDAGDRRFRKGTVHPRRQRHTAS